MDTPVDRSALALRLQEALDALESGDETAWRQRIDSLVAARTQPMMSGLSRLARELGPDRTAACRWPAAGPGRTA